jgi:ferredoxin-NADP reductase
METALELVRRQREADDVVSFFFRPNRPLTFFAGQFLDLSLPHPAPDTRGSTRALTIASAPAEPLLQFTTRMAPTPSTFKQALAALRPGEVVSASGPYGEFGYVDEAAPFVLIAGGIGITPFRSLLVDLASQGSRSNATLLYSNASSSIPFRATFDALTPAWPELRLAYTVTRPGLAWDGPSGRIDAAFVAHHVPDLARSQFLVCGPGGFVDAMLRTLQGLGVPADHIEHEDFPGYETTVESARVALVG